MSRVRSWLCFLYVWYSASGQKKFFFLWGGSIQGGLNKSSSTLYCNQQCWTMTPWGWRWGKSCHQLSQAPPCPPRCEGWSQVPLGALQLAAQEVNWGQLCHGSCWQAVCWLRPLGAQLEGDTPGDVSFFLFYTGILKSPGPLHNVEGGFPIHKSREVIPVNQKKNWNRLVVSDSLRPHGPPIRLLWPWDFPGKNTGVGCHFLLQGIFPAQGLDPSISHCRQTLYRLSHQGSTSRFT